MPNDEDITSEERLVAGIVTMGMIDYFRKKVLLRGTLLTMYNISVLVPTECISSHCNLYAEWSREITLNYSLIK